MKGFIYILRSLKNNRFYVGSTVDIRGRLRIHNKGYVVSTNKYRPFVLAYFQEYKDIRLARRIELKLKKLKRRDYLEKIIKDQYIKMGR